MDRVERCLETLREIFPFLRNSENVPNNHLYHYTSPGVLLQMLNTEGKCGLCCTHYRFLNDDEEFEYGIKLVLDWVRSRNKTEMWNIPEFAVRMDSLAEKIRTTVQNEYTSWVMSLSMEMDSVSQWMSYTDHEKGGFAIGVKWRDLIKSVVSLDSVSQRFRSEEKFEIVWYVAPCFYVQKNKSRDSPDYCTDESRQVAFTCLDAILRRFGGAEMFKHDRAVVSLARMLILFASCIKKGEFKHEREWRVVALTDSEFDFKAVEFIGGKPRIRLPVKSSLDLIDKFVVSHHGNRERLKLLAEMLCKKYPNRFHIRESKTSYVGQ